MEFIKCPLYVGPNRPDLSPLSYVCSLMQQQVYWTLFRNVDELKKQLLKVWSKTLSALLTTTGECICVLVFTQTVDISNGNVSDL